MKQMKALLAKVLIAVLVIGMMPMAQGVEADAAAKEKLSTKKLNLVKGKSKKVSVKKAKKYKISWKIKKKKIAKIKKSGKYAVKVTAKKVGKTTLSCTLKKGRQKKKLTCTVKVKAAAATSRPSSRPIVTAAPTPVPNTASPTPDVTPEPTPVTMKGAYSGLIDNIGTCLAYNQTWNNRKEMQNEETMDFVNQHFNSFTLENEMKPDNTLGGTANLISVAEAEDLGYVLNGYDEATVPKLNLDSIDGALKIAKDRGLRMRGHTLMWHQQTPTWFFKEGYASDGAVVDEETMNARLEFFVRTMVRHVMETEIELTGEAGSLVYAWDVVNEYVHRSNAATSPTWTSVYGDLGLEPTYVKAAFEYAYDELKQKNVQDKVVLFFNDYDTYFSVEDEIAIVNYINEGEETNICGGIGMQSHVDVDRPTLEEYGKALDAFLATGLEVQLTELDITINFDHLDTYAYKNEGQTNEDQAAFTKDLMELIVKKQRERDTKVSPKGITGITVWGLYDSISWRSSMKPLFFTRTRKKNEETGKYEYVIEPKPSFYAFVNANL